MSGTYWSYLTRRGGPRVGIIAYLLCLLASLAAWRAVIAGGESVYPAVLVSVATAACVVVWIREVMR